MLRVPQSAITSAVLYDSFPLDRESCPKNLKNQTCRIPLKNSVITLQQECWESFGDGLRTYCLPW